MPLTFEQLASGLYAIDPQPEMPDPPTDETDVVARFEAVTRMLDAIQQTYLNVETGGAMEADLDLNSYGIVNLGDNFDLNGYNILNVQELDVYDLYLADAIYLDGSYFLDHYGVIYDTNAYSATIDTNARFLYDDQGNYVAAWAYSYEGISAVGLKVYDFAVDYLTLAVGSEGSDGEEDISGGLTWTAGGAPTVASAVLRWTRHGNVVTLFFQAIISSPGTAVTGLVVDISDYPPNAAQWSGVGSGDLLASGTGLMSTGHGTAPTSMCSVFLKYGSAPNFSLFINPPAAVNTGYVTAQIQYLCA